MDRASNNDASTGRADTQGEVLMDRGAAVLSLCLLLFFGCVACAWPKAPPRGSPSRVRLSLFVYRQQCTAVVAAVKAGVVSSVVATLRPSRTIFLYFCTGHTDVSLSYDVNTVPIPPPSSLCASL